MIVVSLPQKYATRVQQQCVNHDILCFNDRDDYLVRLRCMPVGNDEMKVLAGIMADALADAAMVADLYEPQTCSNTLHPQYDPEDYM